MGTFVISLISFLAGFVVACGLLLYPKDNKFEGI